MSKSDLIWAIREIDQDLIREAEEISPIKKLYTRPLRIALIAAAIVVLLSGTVLGVYVGIHWSELMETYFHMDDKDKELMGSYVQPIYATVEQDGCTFSVTQLMGDEHCMVAALEIQLPDTLADTPIKIEDLRVAAKQAGHGWERVQWRLDICYGYDETDESLPVPVFAETAFVPVGINKDELMAATEEYMKDPPDMGIYTHDWAIDNAVSDAHYADLEFKTATFLGQDIMLRDYNKKTNTLTYLVSMHADINLLNRPCTLVISDLYAEDLLATYSQPEVDDGFEPICKSLLTEPVVLNFDAIYEPEGQDFEIYQGDTLIGILELSPFSANVFFPQEPDDPNRLAPNRTDYLDDADIEVTLTDGSVVTYRARSSGFADTQFGFFLTEEIVDLSMIERITLHDYTFQQIDNE